MKKRILLLTTGGTIASQDGWNGLAPVLSSDDYMDDMKEFEELFKAHQEKSRAGSEQKFKGGLAEQKEITKESEKQNTL